MRDSNMDKVYSMQKGEMVKDILDKVSFAIENGFYFEAIMLEYAAMEDRLEIILGILKSPCGNKCDNRRDIKISHRIDCLTKLYSTQSPRYHILSNKSKTGNNYFIDLKGWNKSRNKFVHGLCKDAVQYKDRLDEAKTIAKKGNELLLVLFKETNRLKKIYKKLEYGFTDKQCFSKCCVNNLSGINL